MHAVSKARENYERYRSHVQKRVRKKAMRYVYLHGVTVIEKYAKN